MNTVQSTYPQTTGTAPDKDSPPVNCQGSRRLTVQISNQAVLITFGRYRGNAIVWDPQPELYLPVIGSISPIGGFDAFKYRANVPAAQLPVNALQAFVALTPRT